MRSGVLVFILIAASTPSVWAWSSTTAIGEMFTTHEYLNKKAYEELEKHPAFKKSGFPSLDEIQRHSGVDASQAGLGPDGTANSYFSFHWYNPATGKGNAPAAAQAYYDRLMLSVEGKTPSASLHVNGITMNDEHLETAHSAAYAAHYTQDMTCSFHMVGMPGNNVTANVVADKRVNGPFRDYNRAEWDTVVNGFAALVVDENKTDGNGRFIDWFDPSYFDGQWVLGNKGSSHFLYEGMVELAYKHTRYTGWTELQKLSGFKSSSWSNSDPPKKKVFELSKRLAQKTRDDLDSNANGARIDTVQFQKDVAIISLNTVGSGLSSRAFTAGHKHINVPLNDWWRAIQATYSLWRSTFCALDIEEKDIEIYRLPEGKDQYKMAVMVNNLEKEDARDVKLSFEFKEGFSASGEIRIGAVEAEGPSEYKKSDTSFNFKPENRKGKLIIKITGSYKDTPDSGVTIREFDASTIKVIEFKMPRLISMTKQEATRLAEALPYKFRVSLDNNTEAPRRQDADRVFSQEPVPDTLVAEGESVMLMAYDEYRVKVPQVVGMTKKQAYEALAVAELTPAPANIDVPHDQPEGIVIDQSPSQDTKVELGSSVTISISKRLPAPEPPKDPEPEKETDQKPPPDKEAQVIEPEPVLMELQVSPGGATIEVGQSVSLTAIPIALFPEHPVTPAVVAGMSFQWMANEPGMASVGGSGRSASVTGLKPGTIFVMCITEQAMGLSTIIIKEKTSTDNAASSGTGFKDSFDDWKTPEKDGDNTIPDMPPEPPPEDLFPDVPPPPSEQPVVIDNSQLIYDDQQQAYDDQLRQQQAMREQQAQMFMMNALGIMAGNMAAQRQNSNRNTPHVAQPAAATPYSAPQVTESMGIEGSSPRVVRSNSGQGFTERTYCTICNRLLPNGARSCPCGKKW